MDDIANSTGDEMNEPTMWEHLSVKILPGHSVLDVLIAHGREGWEPWHMELTETGFRTIFFKRPLRGLKEG